MAKATIDSQPTVSRKQAAMFFNMGRDKFLRRWDSHYKFTIRHVESETGLRLLLLDVIKVAFPEASSETRHLIAYHYLQSALERRYITAAKRRTSDDEGDTQLWGFLHNPAKRYISEICSWNDHEFRPVAI